MKCASVSFKMAQTAETLLLLCCAAYITAAQAGLAPLVAPLDSSMSASSENSTANTSFDFFYFVRHARLSSHNVQSVSVPASLKNVTYACRQWGPGYCDHKRCKCQPTG